MNVLAWLGAAATALVGAGSTLEDFVKSPQIAPARDGDIAIQEELCAARRKGTIEAYDLFIARHPQHSLAEIARQERRRLGRR